MKEYSTIKQLVIDETISNGKLPSFSRRCWYGAKRLCGGVPTTRTTESIFYHIICYSFETRLKKII
jgi:hypothetical protein